MKEELVNAFLNKKNIFAVVGASRVLLYMSVMRLG
jgi:hypothetical protein